MGLYIGKDKVTIATIIQQDSGDIPVSERYGLTLNNVFGEVDGNGVLNKPTANINLNFEGVSDLGSSAINYIFQNNKCLKKVEFPDLISVSNSHALYYAFTSSSATEAAFPQLKQVTGRYALNNSFSTCEYLTTASFPELTLIESQNSFENIFNSCSRLTEISFPKLETVSGAAAMSTSCYYCYNLKSASFPSLKSIFDISVFSSVFRNCSSLESIDFSALESVIGRNAFYQAFYGTSKLANLDFSNLKQIGGVHATSGTEFSYAFYNNSGITELTFPSLEYIYCNEKGNTFSNNSTITKMYFPKLKHIGKHADYTGTEPTLEIFKGCSKLTEIHFGAENQEAIEASSGYATLWGLGAGTATIYFDL